MTTAVSLRELSASDLPALNAWRNDPDVIALLGANFRPIAPEIDAAWFQDYLRSRDRHARFAIVVDGGRYVGNVNLTGIHPTNRSAEFSIMIGDRDYWSRGVGSVATRQALRLAFLDLNLHRVFLTVLSSNERAIRLYRRLGFVQEGCERESLFKDGRYQDTLLMAMLRSDYDRALARDDG